MAVNTNPLPEGTIRMSLEEWTKSEMHNLLSYKRMKHQEGSSSTFVTGGVKLGAGVRNAGRWWD